MLGLGAEPAGLWQLIIRLRKYDIPVEIFVPWWPVRFHPDSRVLHGAIPSLPCEYLCNVVIIIWVIAGFP